MKLTEAWRVFLLLVAVFAGALVLANVMRHHDSSPTSPTTPATSRIVPCFDTSGGMHPSYDGISC